MRGANVVKTRKARSLRINSAPIKLCLWIRLRSRAIAGYKFVRQEPIGPYIVDFICRELRLIVELDGGQHATDTRDAVRDKWLKDRGYCVLRFWNNDVFENIDGVLEAIMAALPANTDPHPDREAVRPLPASGER